MQQIHVPEESLESLWWCWVPNRTTRRGAELARVCGMVLWDGLLLLVEGREEEGRRRKEREDVG